MTSGVLKKVTSLCKTFLAVFTLKNVFFGVDSDVLFEITIPGKTFLAVLTLVRVFLSVHSDAFIKKMSGRNRFCSFPSN